MIRTILIVITFAACTIAKYVAVDPFIDIPFKQIKTSAQRIREHGYPAESHYVETLDGYVLNVFRIPYSPKLGNKMTQKPVVLMQHGLFSCSDCFLLNGPDDALAYNFADAGYDVWLGNARGNIYSRNNTKISTKHPYFWQFSWHEIGAVDLPAMIDYILAESGETSLQYVGHSQGTTVFFVLASFVPEYNAKIKSAHMLAPVAYLGNATEGFVTSLSPIFGTPGPAAAMLENQVFLPQNRLIQRILDTACGGESMFQEYCRTLFFLWAGQENNSLNITLLPSLAETHPAGISSNQGIHYLQSHVTNDFRRYDYGAKKNIKHYNQEVPPSYDLSQITADVYLYVGLSDDSANVKDNQRLSEQLANLKSFHVIDEPTWGHLDFIFANKVKETINNIVIDTCLKYEQD